MRTLSYEIFETPQRVTVVPGGSRCSSERRIITRQPDENTEHVHKYAVQSPERCPSRLKRYSYKLQPEQQLAVRSHTHKKPAETRMIEIVSRSSSPDLLDGREPQSILRRTTKTTSRSTNTARATEPVKESKEEFNKICIISRASRSLTSSPTGTFYLAYNVHLSPSLLRQHIVHTPSSTPVAVAKLCNYTWYISSTGQPNIYPCAPSSKQQTSHASSTVYGLLYNVSPASEILLDIHHNFNPSLSFINPSSIAQEVKTPHLQGNNAYNKTYLQVQIEEWLHPPSSHIKSPPAVAALVYVDTSPSTALPGRITDSLVAPLSLAASTALEYGLPKSWARQVMAQHGIKIGEICEVEEHHETRSESEHSNGSNSSSRSKSSDGEEEEEDKEEEVKKKYSRRTSIEIERTRGRSSFY